MRRNRRSSTGLMVAENNGKALVGRPVGLSKYNRRRG